VEIIFAVIVIAVVIAIWKPLIKGLRTVFITAPLIIFLGIIYIFGYAIAIVIIGTIVISFLEGLGYPSPREWLKEHLDHFPYW